MQTNTDHAVSAEQDKAEGLISSIKTFPLPPESFDPLTATDATLKYYGVHLRPDPVKHPLLAKRWEELYSQKIKFIQPTFQPAPPLVEAPIVLDDTTYWSGSVVETPAADPIWFLSASINIPHVVRHSTLQDHNEDYCYSWIGIGGYRHPGSCCRVGVELKAAIGGIAKYRLFLQLAWSFAYVDNFHIEAGDEISLLLCANLTPGLSPFFTIVNENSVSRTQASFTIPNNVGWFSRDSAEWIVSRPGYTIGQEASWPQPVRYGQIEFEDAVAYTLNNNMLPIGRGVPLVYTAFEQAASWPEMVTDTMVKMTSY